MIVKESGGYGKTYCMNCMDITYGKNTAKFAVELLNICEEMRGQQGETFGTREGNVTASPGNIACGDRLKATSRCYDATMKMDAIWLIAEKAHALFR